MVTLPETAGALADLAQAALEAALAIARAEVGPDADRTRLAVIAMGKTGGSELNYISDVDVIFVAEPADGVPEEESTAIATDLATRLMRICSASTPAGSLWQVDPALRPEGKNGPLVRTVASHRSYYERWAKTWEFQALLKARAVAGDAAVGQAYCEAVQPMVWQAVEPRELRRRRAGDAAPGRAAHPRRRGRPAAQARPRWACATSSSRVQLLQLVHGRADESLRTGTTLDGLAALSAGWLRGARRRRDARHGLPAAAHPRAPHPAVPAAAHPPDADVRERPAPAGSRSGTPLLARGGGGRAVARPAARGAAPARADLLPTPAVGRRAALRLRRAPHARGGARAALGAGLPRPAWRPASPRGAHRGASAGGPPSSASCCR